MAGYDVYADMRATAMILRELSSENYTDFDTKMLQRTLELASKGVGQASPNPLVGCVIVSEEGEIVGEGIYVYKDVTHAEVLALKKAGGKARGGTAYVSLEPHAHHGRTPPCTDALINAGIKRVVAPIEDPNPLVSGKGFDVLRENNIEVITGNLKREAEKQNEKFIHWHKAGRPFVHLKMATSLDGKIATRTGDSKWITGQESLKRVHEMRHEHDAVLIGANTADIDNPSLTDRSGKERGKNLFRVILDNSLNISTSSKLVLTAKDIPTIVFTDSEDEDRIGSLLDEGVDVVQIAEGGRNLRGILQELGRREIQSVMVEGGAEVAGSFCDAKLVDKVSFFIAPLIIGGRKAQTSIGGQGTQVLSSSMKLTNAQVSHNGVDIEYTAYPIWSD